jgi:hypothetical protein
VQHDKVAFLQDAATGPGDPRGLESGPEPDQRIAPRGDEGIALDDVRSGELARTVIALVRKQSPEGTEGSLLQVCAVGRLQRLWRQAEWPRWRRAGLLPGKGPVGRVRAFWGKGAARTRSARPDKPPMALLCNRPRMPARVSAGRAPRVGRDTSANGSPWPSPSAPRARTRPAAARCLDWRYRCSFGHHEGCAARRDRIDCVTPTWSFPVRTDRCANGAART